MHGNVIEWCRDIYDDYPEGFVVDPVGPSGGIMAVARGGGFSTNAAHCRSAARMGRYPDDGAGFRVVMVPIMEAQEDEGDEKGTTDGDAVLDVDR